MRNLRNNGVLAYGIVTTFSHEDAEKIDIEKSQQNNVKWLKNTFNLTPKNGKSVRGVMYHGDEYENVHCHSLVVPVNEQGKICAPIKDSLFKEAKILYHSNNSVFCPMYLSCAEQ